jgi:hypothetical protein
MREAAICSDPMFHETPHQYPPKDTARRRSPILIRIGKTRIKVGFIWFRGIEFRSLLHGGHDSMSCNI